MQTQLLKSSTALFLSLAFCFYSLPSLANPPNLNCFSLACNYVAGLEHSYSPTYEHLAARPTKQKYFAMVKETRNMALLSLSIMGVLYVMPESVSKWDKDELKFKKLGRKWKEHISDGPVWDQDEWEINYIGHPYFGAAYYMVARNQGLNAYEASAYSFLMSSFLWEMGIEALAEIPSKQDLLITPLIGSVIGEAFFVWEQRIAMNNDQLMGSRAFGKTVKFLLNPAGSISYGLNNLIDGKPEETYGLTGGWVVQPGYSAFRPGEGLIKEEAWIGIKLDYKY